MIFVVTVLVDPLSAALAVEGLRVRFVARGPRGGIARGRFMPRVVRIRDGRAKVSFEASDRTPRAFSIEARVWDAPAEAQALAVVV